MIFGVRPTPLISESLYGYLIRVMSLNGIDEVSEFSNIHPKLIGMKRNYGAWTKDQFESYKYELQQLTSLSEKDIDCLFKKGAPEWSYNFNNDIRSLLVTFPRICVSCLNENHCIDLTWSQLTKTCCHKHEIELIHTCPNCFAPLEWNADILTECVKCRQKWSALSKHTKCLPSKKELQFYSTKNENDFLYVMNFSKQLLKALRPLDLQVNPLTHINRESLTTKTLKLAYLLTWNEKTQYEQQCLIDLYWHSVSPIFPLSTPNKASKDLLTNLCVEDLTHCTQSDSLLKPKVRKLVDKEIPSHFIVKVDAIANALGLDRKSVRQLKNSELIKPLNPNAISRDQLFDIRHIIEIPHHIKICKFESKAGFIEVNPTSFIFKRFITTYGELLADAVRNEIEAFRTAETYPLATLLVRKANLMDWLQQKLKEKCRTDISISAAKIAGRHVLKTTSIENALKRGDLHLVSSTTKKDMIDGPSFYKFITPL